MSSIPISYFSCQRCRRGQVSTTPDRDGIRHCVQCGAGHNADGTLVISETDRLQTLELTKDFDSNGNGHRQEHYTKTKIFQCKEDGFLPYGIGCSLNGSHRPNCFECPNEKDCEATFRFGGKAQKARKWTFTLTHNYGRGLTSPVPV